MQHDPEWLQHRQFGIVIDAGSSGSRIHIYSWLEKAHLRSTLLPSQLRGVLPTIEPGVASSSPHASEWSRKTEPGIADFSDRPEDVGEHLEVLLDHAAQVIPAAQHEHTPIYLLATAGLRLVAEDARRKILDNTCSYLRENYTFKIGRCEDHIKNISGEEEGLFGWVAINYLMGGFDHGGVKVLHPPQGEEDSIQPNDHNQDQGSSASDYHAPGEHVPSPDQAQEQHEDAQRVHRHTLGFLDMGGASTQIAFEPSTPASQAHANDLTKVTIHTLDNQELSYNVFVTTFLGYGTNEARRRYVKDYLMEEPASKELLEKQPAGVRFQLEDPCLPRNLLMNETHITPHVPLAGAGSFSKCLEKVEPLLNKQAACYDEPCLFNGVHTPPIDFNVNTFIGVSEYWYSSHDILGLGGAYDYAEFERKSAEFCESDWDEIIQRPEFQGLKHERLEMQCFKSAWLSNVLHGGFGLPRYGERGAGGSSEQANEVLEQADESVKEKQWVPTFQSINSIKDIQVTWTLGAMLLYSSGAMEKATMGGHHPHTPSAILPPSDHPPPHEESYTERMLDSYNHIMFLAIVILILAVFWVYRSRSSKAVSVLRRLFSSGGSLHSPTHGGPSFFARLRRTNTGTDYSALESGGGSGGGGGSSPRGGVFGQRWSPKFLYLAIVHHTRSFWWTVSSRLWPEPAAYELAPTVDEGIQSISIGGYDSPNLSNMVGGGVVGAVGPGGGGGGGGPLDSASSTPGGLSGYGASSVGLSSIPEGTMSPSLLFESGYRAGTPHGQAMMMKGGGGSAAVGGAGAGGAGMYRQPPKASNNKFFGGRINKKRFSGDSQSLFKEGFAVNTTGIAQSQATKSGLELTARSGSNNPNLAALYTRSNSLGNSAATDSATAAAAAAASASAGGAGGVGVGGSMSISSSTSNPTIGAAGTMAGAGGTSPWKQGWMPNEDHDFSTAAGAGAGAGSFSSRDDDLLSPGLPYSGLSSSRSDRSLHSKHHQSPSQQQYRQTPLARYKHLTTTQSLTGESHSAPSSTWNLSSSLTSATTTATTAAAQYGHSPGNNGFATSADERDEWSADGGGDGDDEGDDQASSYFHRSHGDHHRHHHHPPRQQQQGSHPNHPYGFARTNNLGGGSQSGMGSTPNPSTSSVHGGRKRSTGFMSSFNFESGAGAMTPLDDGGIQQDDDPQQEGGYQSGGGYSSSGSYYVAKGSRSSGRATSGVGVGMSTTITSTTTTTTATTTATAATTSSMAVSNTVSSGLLPPGYVPGSRPTSRSVSPLMTHQTASTSTSSLVLGRHNITEMDQQLVSRASSENVRRGSLGAAVMSP